jgi:hypothetical protein
MARFLSPGMLGLGAIVACIVSVMVVAGKGSGFH